MPALMTELQQAGMLHVLVVVGGIIPPQVMMIMSLRGCGGSSSEHTHIHTHSHIDIHTHKHPQKMLLQPKCDSCDLGMRDLRRDKHHSWEASTP